MNKVWNKICRRVLTGVLSAALILTGSGISGVTWQYQKAQAANSEYTEGFSDLPFFRITYDFSRCDDEAFGIEKVTCFGSGIDGSVYESLELQSLTSDQIQKIPGRQFTTGPSSTRDNLGRLWGVGLNNWLNKVLGEEITVRKGYTGSRTTYSGVIYELYDNDEYKTIIVSNWTSDRVRSALGEDMIDTKFNLTATFHVTADHGHVLKYNKDESVLPTCQSEGLEVYDCSQCDYRETKTVAKTSSHDYEVVTEDYNGMKAGRQCERCRTPGCTEYKNVRYYVHIDPLDARLSGAAFTEGQGYYYPGQIVTIDCLMNDNGQLGNGTPYYIFNNQTILDGKCVFTMPDYPVTVQISVADYICQFDVSKAEGLGQVNSMSYRYGRGVEELPVPKVEEGYQFGGWYSDEALTKQVTEISKDTTGNVILYAKSSKISYQITYDLGGKAVFKGNSQIATSYQTGEEIVLPTAEDIMFNDNVTNCRFVGWAYAQDEQSDQVFTTLPADMTGNLALKAVYETDVPQPTNTPYTGPTATKTPAPNGTVPVPPKTSTTPVPGSTATPAATASAEPEGVAVLKIRKLKTAGRKITVCGNVKKFKTVVKIVGKHGKQVYKKTAKGKKAVLRLKYTVNTGDKIIVTMKKKGYKTVKKTYRIRKKKK